MRTKNELYQEALRTVARRRQTARAKAEDARAEAEAAVPGLRHAEEEVRVRGIRCALAGAGGQGPHRCRGGLTVMPAKSWPTCWPPAAVPLTHWSRTSPQALRRHRHCGRTQPSRPQADAAAPPVGDRGSVQPLHFQLRYHGTALLPRPDGRLLGEPIRSYMSTLLTTCRLRRRIPIPPARA